MWYASALRSMATTATYRNLVHALTTARNAFGNAALSWDGRPARPFIEDEHGKHLITATY